MPIDPWKVYSHLRNKVNWAKCDKCDFHWPEDILNVRGDGRKICPNHKDYRESSAQRTNRIQRAAARIAKRREPIPKFPNAPEMRGVSGVTLLTPAVTALIRGGANKVVLLTGVNLSAADVFAFSSASVALAAATTYTAIDADTHGNTATLTVNAPGGGTNGDFDLTVNGDVFPRVFIVRG